MMEFNWGSLSKGVQTASSLAQMSEIMQPPGIRSVDFNNAAVTLLEFSETCEMAGLPISAASAKRLSEWLSQGLKSAASDEYAHKIFSLNASTLASVINDEFSINKSLKIEPGLLAFYEAHEPFGHNVIVQFPSLQYEISEAGKCLAFERSTAAAFHLIRSLEAGIMSMSRCLGIADPIKGSQRSWFKALDAIKKEIDVRWPPTNIKSGDGQLFEELHGALSGMQNPYRNATMHLDTAYTEEDARSLYEIVKGLIQRIAARMDENGLPLA